MQDRYFVEAADGQRYGPADLAALKEWGAEGRITASSILVLESTGERRRADTVAGLFGSGGDGSLPPIVPGVPPHAAPVTHVPFAQTPPPKKNTTLIVAVTILAGFGICVVPVLAAILFPIFAQAKLAGTRTKGLSGMKQLGLGTLLYAGDFDDHFPLAMENAAAAQPVINPYLKNPAVFKTSNPKGGEILGDKRLSRRLITNLVDESQTVVFRDSVAWSRGDVAVAHADGSARFTREPIVATLLAKDPFGGISAAEERRQEKAAH